MAMQNCSRYINSRTHPTHLFIRGFSKLAVVDFQLKNLTGARAGPQAFAASQVRVLNTRPVAPPNADEGATSKAEGRRESWVKL